MKRGFLQSEAIQQGKNENSPSYDEFLFYRLGYEGLTYRFTIGFFYSSRHRPFIKQVHSLALTTILALTEAISAFFGIVNRKEINTEYGLS